MRAERPAGPPTVSCLFMSNASLSLVPTPSVPATRKESPAGSWRSACMSTSAGAAQGFQLRSSASPASN